MKIDQEKCVACQNCILYCPVDAIKIADDRVYIDQESCVECSTCFRSGTCDFDALHQPELGWPREIRGQFSDPPVGQLSPLKRRGSRGVKTNDVTGNLRRGEVGFTIEMGRPGILASFTDLEKVTMAIAGEVVFDPLSMMTSRLYEETGRLRVPELRKERAVSVSVSCKTSEDKGVEVLKKLKKVSEEIDTVFSLGLTIRCQGYEIPFKKRLEEAGYEPRINGKTNVGLGRPLA